VVPPDALEGEVHALLALARSGYDRAVRIDASGAPCGAAPAPHLSANIVDGIHQPPHRVLVEPAQIIAGGRGVGNGSSAERVEERGVVAADLDVVQNLAPAEQVERDVEDVIGVLLWPSHLENARAFIDGRRQLYAFDQTHQRADAPHGIARVRCAIS
jgi:hypothetical protein